MAESGDKRSQVTAGRGKLPHRLNGKEVLPAPSRRPTGGSPPKAWAALVVKAPQAAEAWDLPRLLLLSAEMGVQETCRRPVGAAFLREAEAAAAMGEEAQETLVALEDPALRILLLRN